MSAENAGKPLANAKHEAVLLAYIADPERVGYRCYISVYPNSTEAAAKTAFSRLLKNADFTARLAELTKNVADQVIEKTGITVERVIEELAKIGFANMADYMQADSEGRPRLSFSELSRDQTAALQEVTVEEDVERARAEEEESGNLIETVVRKTKFKLYDKRAALVDIGKHLGAFTDKVKHEHSGPNGEPIKHEVELSELELARRIAFALEQGARSTGKSKPAAAAPIKPKGKKR